jgi:hypothetical protein
MHSSRRGWWWVSCMVGLAACGPGTQRGSPGPLGGDLGSGDAGTSPLEDTGQISTTRPDQDGDGLLDPRDLEVVLVRWESGAAYRTEVNDVLGLLYWRERVAEDVLLEVLQRHHYGDDWSALLGELRAQAAARYTTSADGGTDSDSSHSTRDSGLHQKYFSSQYDPNPGKHEAEVSRNHDLYISRSWNHQESQSRLNGDPWWPPHSSSTSATWPSNHDRRLSKSFPSDHQDTVSRSWPPGHHGEHSKTWNGPTHTTSVSRAWPPSHIAERSDKGEDFHLDYTSRQYPMPHEPGISRSHSFAISNSWPNYPLAHSTVASHTRPPNHFEAVSRSWPTEHLAIVSGNWPPNHYDEVSKQWTQNDPGVHSSTWSRIFPPGHTYFTSVKDTVGIIKDIKGAVSPKPEK